MAIYPAFDLMIFAWADWYASQNDTTIGGVATTNYAAYDLLAQYMQSHGLNARVARPR